VSAKPWLDHRVLVTVGTGGVGKTTVGAAIGLEAARRGKRALVVTIDPARRLADALGIGELGHEPRTLPREVLRKAGIEGPGELVAMMLDTKRTFDELVSRYSPDEEALERILANPIYQNLTDALAGSREYSAMEKLHQLHSAGEYDLIVLDTPPSTHALEFLDAPRRLTGFLQSDFLKLLFRPALVMGRTGFRLFRFGSATVLRVMERLTGIGFLRTISDFLLAFESMLEGFTTRAAEIEALLRDPVCGFVLVVGPDPEQARRALDFSARLQEDGIGLLGLVMNRVRTWPGSGPVPELDEVEAKRITEWLAKGLADGNSPFDPKRTARNLVGTLTRQALLARRDAEVCAHLEKTLALPPETVRRIPLFSEDVHALGSLRRMASYLFGNAADV
jgi:anion-transporting  ArsA/GET3 family ATPase